MAGARLNLMTPQDYPAGLDIPVVARVEDNAGNERRVNGWVSATGYELNAFRVLRGVELKYEPWDEMQSTLAHVDVVKSDAVEAEFLTGETDIFKAAKYYAEMGPKEVVLTHKDGLLIYADGNFHEMNFYPARLDGRSGRGDTCLGTYVAKRLSLAPREAGIWAAAVTSLKMEDAGPFHRSLPEVEAFIRARYDPGSVP